MSEVVSQTRSQAKPDPSLLSSGQLQRQCACGSHTAAGGTCSDCSQKEDRLQRKSMEGNHSPGFNTRSGFPLQGKLTIGASDDPLEREADRVADQVMSMRPTPSMTHTAPRIQRFTGQPSRQATAAPSSVERVLASAGAPLEPGLREDMEARFGYDFSKVRVHSGPAAEQSARDADANAYTVGRNIVFGRGRFAPETHEGRRLIAHELTHTVQQLDLNRIGTAERNERRRSSPVFPHHEATFKMGGAPEAVLQRQRSGGRGSGVARPPHITEVRVNQNTPQKVIVTYSDGGTVSDECSTGKGHCCFDDTAGTAEGGTCSAARSTQVGNNCTPVGAFTVTARIRETRGGVRFWTQFHDAKSVALHEYTPVDGTPLSHGCVRLHAGMAQAIFDGARVGVTRVRVEGLARPGCQDAALQREWESDFVLAGSSPPDGPRLTRAEIVRQQRDIQQTRKDIGSALGVEGAALDAELSLVRSGGSASIVSKIPRCVPALTTEEQRVASAQSAGFLTSAAGTTASSFGVALNRTRTMVGAEQVVRQFGEQLWRNATARAGQTGTDDRQLYWTRLMLTVRLRQWNPSWISNADSLRRLHVRLLSLLEQTSRGMTSSAFPTHRPDLKRILISGFDPFGFPNPGSDIRQSNLSGAAAMALDGETLSQSGVSARVEAVVFPVRYADFNEGIVENHLRPHLSGPQPPHLVMSISQGGEQFEFEEWAGRRRSSDSFQENLGRLSGGSPTNPIVPPGLASGNEFLPHTVPSSMLRALRGAVGRTAPIPAETRVLDLPHGARHPRELPSGPGANPGEAVEGSGGGFLSNEIFYRNSLLRTQSGSNVPLIHLHTLMLPPGASDTLRNDLIARVRQILQASLPYL